MTRLPMPKLTDSDVQRLWAGIDVGDEDDCWFWKRSCDRDGYGIFTHRRIHYVVTRIMYYYTHGVDPQNDQVCHICDTPSCCNPKHLWLGTQRENVHDSMVKGRAADTAGEQNGHACLTGQDILMIRNSNQSSVQLAEYFDVSERHISRIQTGENWSHVGGPVRARVPARKLTPDQVQEIRTLYATGEYTKSALGRQFGVSHTHIRRLVA